MEVLKFSLCPGKRNSLTVFRRSFPRPGAESIPGETALQWDTSNYSEITQTYDT